MGGFVKFDYDFYTSLIKLILDSGYSFRPFCSNADNHVVIMRHDVDVCLEKALEMAVIEQGSGIQSTYFIMVSGLYYNVFQKKSKQIIQRIASLGHDIGLHFDNTQCLGKSIKQIKDSIDLERAVLTHVLDGSTVIRCISEHIPTKEDLGLCSISPDLISAYSEEFFLNYKYLSDSDMFWREDVVSIIQSRQHNRLQILTHPIWYNDTELDKKEILSRFICQKVFDHHAYLDILCKSNTPELEDFINERCRDFITNNP